MGCFFALCSKQHRLLTGLPVLLSVLPKCEVFLTSVSAYLGSRPVNLAAGPVGVLVQEGGFVNVFWMTSSPSTAGAGCRDGCPAPLAHASS